jgi:hypothetical protein
MSLNIILLSCLNNWGPEHGKYVTKHVADFVKSWRRKQVLWWKISYGSMYPHNKMQHCFMGPTTSSYMVSSDPRGLSKSCLHSVNDASQKQSPHSMASMFTSHCRNVHTTMQTNAARDTDPWIATCGQPYWSASSSSSSFCCCHCHYYCYLQPHFFSIS